MNSLFGRLGRIVSLGLAVLLFLTPFAIGGVHGWASALLELGIWALGLGWFIARRLDRRLRADAETNHLFLSLALALASYLVFQLVPLPRGLLGAISPATDDFYRHTIDWLGPGRPTVEPIRPVGEFEDGQVSVATRARIAAMATAPSDGPPEDWRPIAIYPFAAWSDFLRYLAYGFALWLAATLPRPRLLLRAIVLAGVAVATVGIVQNVTWNGYILWFFSPYEQGTIYYPRMSGPFVDPDHFAAFLEMGFPCGAALIALRWHRLRGRHGPDFAAARIAFGLAIMVAALIGSASRAGIAGSVIGMLVFWRGLRSAAPLRDEHAVRRHATGRARVEQALRRLAPAALVVGIIGGGLLYAGPLAHQTLQGRLLNTLLAPDFGFRVRLWIQSLPIPAQFPLVGVGAGGWREVMPRFQYFPILGLQHTHAHNDYLEWAIETGLAGVLLTAAMLWALARWARHNHSIPAAAHWGILGSIVAIGWHEMFDFSLRMPANALVLSVLFGLLCNRTWGRVSRDTPADGGYGYDDDGGGAHAHPLRTAAAIAAAVAVTIFLVAGSVQQFREFMQWKHARGGNPELHLAPANADTWEYIGTQLFVAGFRYEPPTQDVFRTAAQLRPAGGNAYWAWALTAPLFEDKARALEAALFADPTRTRWRLLYASTLEVLGRNTDALAQMEEAAYLDPRIGSHAYLRDHDQPLSDSVVAAVERGLRHALAEHPNNSELLSEVATFYDLRDQWTDAAALWERAADRGGWARFGLRAAKSHAKGGQYAPAEAAARRVIDADPEEADGYRVLALAVLRPQQRYDDAERTLRAGLQQCTDTLPIYQALAELERERGNVPGALDAMAHAADLRPLDAGLRFRLGEAYFAAGEFLRAKMAIDRAIGIDRRPAKYYYLLGATLERLYELAGARDAYRKAAELDPSNALFAQSAARIDALFAEAGQR